VLQSRDGLTPASPAQILLDGANGVGLDPREHFPAAATSLPLAAFALVVAIVVVRTRLRRPLFTAALLAFAVPGLVLVLAQRGDAPAARPALASQVRQAVEQLSDEVRWPRTRARVVREDDDVLFPVGRYALPGRAAAAAGVDGGLEQLELLELRGSSLTAGCRTEADNGHRVCGAGP
jgi:hypothetical protein